MAGAFLALALVGCSKPSQPAPVAENSPQAQAAAASAEPTDPHLAQLYDASCRACHGKAGSGAPLTRDAAAWAARWAKGMPALMDSTVKGKAGMPAGGQCFACQAEDYAALIRFLSGHEGDKS